MFMQKLFFFLLILILCGCTTPNHKEETKTVKETIPITMANMRGHQSLYNEGWFVITSSKDVLKFAKEHGLDNAKDALVMAKESILNDTTDYSETIFENVEDGYNTTASVFNKGTQRSKNIFKTTQELAELEIQYSKKSFAKAWESFIKGNITLSSRTEKEQQELTNMAGNYFKDLRSDFSNLGEIASSITFSGSKDISKHWEEAFVDAQKSFKESYDDSGNSDSTLGGLLHIMYGYFKVIYRGVIKPTAKTAKSAAEGTYSVGEDMAKLAYLPIGASVSVAGRTIESLGLTLYYSSSIGVKIVSPTVEAGFLSALSILSLSSTSLTYVGGGTLGVVNQIGTTAISPVAGVTQTVGQSAVDTTKLVTFVSYDVLKASTEIFINEAASGVVLGYNALLALPTHTLLAASDTVFFLAWDGPRLVVATAKGEIAKENINNLPVGTVIDLKSLKKEEGIEVKIISKDYSVIEKILNKMPYDTRK